MEDCVAMSSVIKREFEWPSYIPQRTDERAAFDIACSKWETYEADKMQSLHDGAYLGSSQSTGDGKVGGGKDRGKGGHEVKKGPVEDKRLPVLSSSARTHPSNRLCRTLRVFVAWKA
jgi:hypothetical protein